MGWHNKTTLEALTLIASEVGEAVNECRGETPTPEFGSELADIILRVADLAHWIGLKVDLTNCESPILPSTEFLFYEINIISTVRKDQLGQPA